jgi:DNA invertase Pin-like site-specific DNA recombinase
MMNGIDTRRPGGRLQASMMALFAEEELIKIRTRTREVLNHKRMRGTPYSRSVPYGIQYIDGKLYRDETEMKNVSRIKNLHSRGWSWYKIGKTFNEEGIRTKNGKDWRTQSVINTYKFHYEK